MAAKQDVTEFLDLIDLTCLPAPAFGMRHLDDVLSWCGPVSPLLNARLLSALVSAEPDAGTIAACADAIAALDGWRALMLDLLAAADPGATAVAILHKVLRARGITHPLAAMAEPPKIVTVINDALNRPDGLLVSVDHRLPAASAWLLLAVTDPIGQSASAVGIARSEGLLLAASDAPWFERDRAVCPAFFLLAA